MKKPILSIISIVLCCAMLLLSSCDVNIPHAISSDKESRKLLALDTVIDITVYDSPGEDVFTTIEDWLDLYENRFSTTIADSEISNLNNNRGTFQTVTPETFNLLKRAVQATEATNGAFDIAVYPIVKAWGFTTDEYRVPSAEELSRLIMFTDSRKIQFNDENFSVRLLSDMQIDLGGIAKGYIAMKLAEKIEQKGVTSALISLGGNIQAIGSKPDGSAWQVGIQHPDYDNRYIGVLSINNEAAITSGAYQRYFEQDGKRYHHIIDPSTGAPSESDLLSVTVVTNDGTMGDAVSTAFFVMGSEKTKEFLDKNSQFNVVMLTKDYKVLVSEELKNRFELGDDFSERDLSFI